jgi:fatty acid desaturase
VRRDEASKREELQPASAIVALLGAIGSAVALWVLVGWWLGIIVLALMPLYVVNVALGGGFNDSPLDGISRFQPFRRNPRRFLP